MTTLSRDQARAAAYNAGFRGNAIEIILAIAMAESSLNTNAQNRNTDGSLDRGILQINAKWHPEVSDACAYSAECAFKAGYKISSNGTNFQPWSTYTNGAYRKYLQSTSGGTNNGGQTAKPNFQWLNYAVTDRWRAGHYAVDIATPYNTPITAPWSGIVTEADYEDWGGEVYVKGDPGTPGNYVIFHFDDVHVKTGQRVSTGQRLGLSGGQTSGGKHPVRNVGGNTWSTGPHTHIGLFESFKNGIPYGADILPWLNKIKAGQIIGKVSETVTNAGQTVSNGYVTVSQKVHDTLVSIDGFEGIALALDQAEQFPGYIDMMPKDSIDAGAIVIGALRSTAATIQENALAAAIRSLFIFIGLILLIGLLYNLYQEAGISELAMEAAL